VNHYLITIKNGNGHIVEQFVQKAINLRLALEASTRKLGSLDAGHGQDAVRAAIQKLDGDIIERTYFAIPNFTGYGPEFETFAEALAHCNARFHSEFVRQFIDVRVVERYSDGSGGSDHVAARYEVPNPLAA
jgi:hypothetical protein